MRLDIVIPAHNEEHRIDATLRAYRAVCSGPDVRIRVALDWCTDGTATIVARHAAADPRVGLLEYPKLGKGGVLREAFRRCDADYVAFVDADCATPPGELLRLVDACRHADGAIATRRHPASVLPRPRSLSRRMTSAGFALCVRGLFGLTYSDTQCGAKVIRRGALQRILPLLSLRDFVFDVDLLLVARALNLRVVEMPTIWIDKDGSRMNVLADTRRMVLSLLLLWLSHRAAPLPRATPAPAPLPTGQVVRV